ncbi:MAG TPA: 2-isopropylmalate synthase, partial [Deltaproteobacteria bacterium]|nr:2-isopropylmalate synthase [Deltaproteobacteria bacterium]
MSTSQDRIIIFDTTLRDGEQSPGASMDVHEKVLVAKQLEMLGVDKIEAGFPISSPGDFDAVQAIAGEITKSSVVGLCRAKDEDIKAAWEAVKDARKPCIHTFIATSDIHLKYQLRMSREEVLKAVEHSVGLCSSLCNDVEFSAMDATRSDWDYLADVYTVAIEAGAKTINVPDTVGYTNPQEFYNLITHLRNKVRGIEKAVISVHCHNDLGMAVANSVSAVMAGARQIECTINGIGERAGNTSLEEVVMIFNVRRDLYG